MGFVTSAPGGLTVGAILNSVLAFILFEVAIDIWPIPKFFPSLIFKPFNYNRSKKMIAFEVATMASFVFLSAFLIFAVTNLHRRTGWRTRTLKWIMVGHSAFWAVFLMVTSAFIMESTGKVKNPIKPGQNDPSNFSIIFTMLSASGSIGLSGAITLILATIILLLDLFGVRASHVFDESVEFAPTDHHSDVKPHWNFENQIAHPLYLSKEDLKSTLKDEKISYQ